MASAQFWASTDASQRANSSLSGTAVGTWAGAWDSAAGAGTELLRCTNRPATIRTTASVTKPQAAKVLRLTTGPSRTGAGRTERAASIGLAWRMVVQALSAAARAEASQPNAAAGTAASARPQSGRATAGAERTHRGTRSVARRRAPGRNAASSQVRASG